MDQYVQKVNQAVSYIKKQFGSTDFKPEAALVLGSGLDKIADLIEPIATIPYKDIPNFPITTVAGHEGLLIIGYLEGVPIIGLKGRKHYYEVANENNGMEQVIFPVHVVASLGCKLYIATNAAGGLNPRFSIGDLMIIRSHLDIFMQNPLLGPHHDFGNNFFFQPQNELYDRKISELFRSDNQDIHEGVYACLTGRTYESAADSTALRVLGVDAVGMSTVPEIIIAANRGMKTLGISTITNVIAADGTNATNHEEVVAILNSRETKAKLLFAYQAFFQKLNQSLKAKPKPKRR